MDYANYGLTFLTGAVIPVLLFWVGLYFKRKDKRELAFGLIDRKALVLASQEVRQQVKLTYQGEEIGGLDSLTVAIQNTGQVPITLPDFQGDGRIRIEFENVTKIFEVTVEKSVPHDLGLTFLPDGPGPGSISCSSSLLNPGDYCRLRVLAAVSGRVQAKLSTRITGVPAFAALRDGEHPGNPWPFLLFLVGSGAALGYLAVQQMLASQRLAALCFGVLAAGSIFGAVYVWRLFEGLRFVRFSDAHKQGGR